MASLFYIIIINFLWVGSGGGYGGFFKKKFQVVFGVESGLHTVHFPLGQWAVKFSCMLLSVWGVAGLG